VFYGGRNAAKSWSIARALVHQAYTEKHLILCTRQFQNSIADSVHRVVQAQIVDMGLIDAFDITVNSIFCRRTGSEFIFKGLQRNINEIRSLEGVTRCWIEEASNTTLDNWLVLDPTIRRAGAQIFISYNPEMDEDPLHALFTGSSPPPNSFVRKTTFRDNPFTNEENERLRVYMFDHDQDNYHWVWEGETRKNTDAQVFKGKVFIETFDEAPHKTRFYFGLDFGFSESPTCLLRCWIKPNDSGFGEDLMIDREAYGYHIEIDELPSFFDNSIEDVRKWQIKADSEDPATISYLSRQGFQIVPADKWPGFVEEGVRHIRGFRRVVIHPTFCPNAARDFRLYSFKVDPKAVDKDGKPLILPLLVDKNDHAPDATRYALSDFIQSRGGMGVWTRLVRPNR
jgi:phage terminase large subunit